MCLQIIFVDIYSFMQEIDPFKHVQEISTHRFTLCIYYQSIFKSVLSAKVATTSIMAVFVVRHQH